MNLRGLLIGAIALGACIALTAPASAGTTVLSSTFDESDEGWVAIQSPYEPAVTTEPTFSSTGGNPGGFVSVTDSDNHDTDSVFWQLSSPESWDGDRSAFAGGSLSADANTPGEAPPIGGATQPYFKIYH